LVKSANYEVPLNETSSRLMFPAAALV
jgi:hypothetical protein